MEQYNKVVVSALQDPDFQRRLSDVEFLTSVMDILKTCRKSDPDANTPASRKAAKELRKEIRRAKERLSLSDTAK